MLSLLGSSGFISRSRSARNMREMAIINWRIERRVILTTPCSVVARIDPVWARGRRSPSDSYCARRVKGVPSRGGLLARDSRQDSDEMR